MPSIGPMRPLRAAGKNERRCIMRHRLGYYGGLVVATKYVLKHPAGVQRLQEETFLPALRYCVARHPILSAAIANEETEAPRYVRPEALDLRDHLQMLDPQGLVEPVETPMGVDWPAHLNDRVKAALVLAHDRPFEDRDTIPPWKVLILPVDKDYNSKKGPSDEEFWVIFSFSHSHGDGKSGLAFHRSFLYGLQHSTDPTSDDETNHLCPTPTNPLLPPLEEAANLPISWMYLLSPLFGQYLPGFISSRLGLKASVTPDPPGMWRGEPASYDSGNFHTGVELRILHDWYPMGALAACRAHGAKMTALFHQLICQSLDENLPEGDNFVAQTAVDLRGLIPALGDNDMAVCASGDYEVFPRALYKTQDCSEAMWSAARKTSAQLAACASTLQDQPLGLLHYLSNFRGWLQGKLGKPRDSSYELSNIMIFGPSPGPDSAGSAAETATERATRECAIQQVVFSQPAHAVGSPISFNFVTMKGGDLAVTLCWQRGALGVDDEDAWAREVLERFDQFLSVVAADGHEPPKDPPADGD